MASDEPEADAQQVDAEIAADKAREKSLGLTFGTAASTAPQSSDDVAVS
jgi:hypothetical protein